VADSAMNRRSLALLVAPDRFRAENSRINVKGNDGGSQMALTTPHLKAIFGPIATLSALVLLAYKNIFARGGIRAKQGPARSDPVRDKDLT
jgi:hypothetical protein